jgi:hypothetical protein
VRFVSHIAAFAVQVIEQRDHYTQYGDRMVDREGFTAHFNQNDLNEGDVEFAERIFGAEGLHGRTTEVDEVTLTPIVNRLSVFDTDEEAGRQQWAGQTVEIGDRVYDKKEYIEDWLAAHAVDHPDFRQIVTVPLQPPWPNYLAYRGTPEQLLTKLEAEGHDLDGVLRYEEQLGQRPEMIGVLRERIRELETETAGALEVPA